MIATDTILQNRYRVLRPLGRGGMGAVYEAADVRLSRIVALKETLVESDALRRAFEREARLLANLRHPALPKVLDHFSEAAGLFLVMEFIPGDDLGAMLEERGSAFSPAEVLLWADQLLDALEYLHTLEPPVIHRDIKPQNLKLISPRQIVLLDFGLAKGTAGQMTRTGNSSLVAYSPNYSPLEQMQGAGTDERSDLYSLGATLYHLLTGVKPPDALSRAASVVNGQPDPLRPAHAVSETVPAAASAALMRAMALNIENRPRTVSEMRRDLHDERPRASATVPVTEADEITKVSLPRDLEAPVAPPPVIAQRETRRQVVVDLPEETRVAQRPAGGKRIAVIGLLAALLALPVVLYLLFFAPDGGRQRRTPPAVAESTPRPTPTPTVDANLQANIDNLSQNGPAELDARARLAQKNIPYSEESFSRAIENGDTDAVELFLAAGMSTEAKDAAGRTALIQAAARGSNHISQQLLGRGADVNAQDTHGSTALMEAAGSDHRETAEVLMRRGADVNLRDTNGQTALIRAAARGHSRIVRMLIERGARTDIKDRQGLDAQRWAEINDQSDVVELLRKVRPRP